MLLDWVVEISRMTKAEIVENPKTRIFFFCFSFFFFSKPTLPQTGRYIQQTETVIPITHLLIQNNGSFGSCDNVFGILTKKNKTKTKTKKKKNLSLIFESVKWSFNCECPFFSSCQESLLSPSRTDLCMVRRLVRNRKACSLPLAAETSTGTSDSLDSSH